MPTTFGTVQVFTSDAAAVVGGACAGWDVWGVDAAGGVGAFDDEVVVVGVHAAVRNNSEAAARAVRMTGLSRKAPVPVT
ncbi:hypothetical protein V1227_20790 [Lentzea sp. DG1S-22]|uniref:hypothetical protein n=1 Tax=Lentzea sp. DG1S-22 TaxID=3108822 RepID=UPI002E76E407|nr:hypothetical protein [Lentzea sp. DG1S-22]WVH77560.1 hypothetical protein V1227_20790 [Lentzea sp. DG1S-22]